VIRSGRRPGPFADGGDDVLRDACRPVGVGQGAIDDDVVNAVVAEAADVATAGGDDAVEERELGVATVHDVQAIGLDGPFEHRPFVARAAPFGGDVDAAGDVAVDFEVSVQAPLDQAATRLRLEQGGGGHLRQSRQQGGIDEGGGVAHVLEPGVATQGFELAAQFGDDLHKPLRVEATDRFGKRAERGSRTAEFLLHVTEFAGLLQPAKRSDDGVEEKQQHQHAVVVEVEGAIAGAIARTADVVQAL